jgi:cation diffusion facilitator family transporter
MPTTTIADAEATRLKRRAAVASVASNIVLVALKYVVGFATGSAAVVSEGTHSLTDLVAAALAWYAVRKASEPADARHPFGHEKFESISGFAEGLLIIGAAVTIVVGAALKILHGVAAESLGWGMGVMALSAAANTLVSGHLFRVARATDSLALLADAEHLRTDVFTSVGVFAGLAIARLTGWLWLDPVVAIAVAIAIVFTGVRIVRHAMDHLVDAALPEAEEAAIQELLNEHAGRFLEFHELRTRKAGSVRHIDLHLVMDGNITLQEAHDVADHLEEDLKSLLPGAQVIIHPEPHGEALSAVPHPGPGESSR